MCATLKENVVLIRNNVEEARPRCRCVTSIRSKFVRGAVSDINNDDTLACVSFLFWLFSLLEIKRSYVLSRIVCLSFNKRCIEKS